MMLTASALRAIVRTTNAAGSTLKRAGCPSSRSTSGVCSTPPAAPPGWTTWATTASASPPMVLQGLETEARLTLVGRIAARQDVVGLLASRLRLVDDGKASSGDRCARGPAPALHRGIAAHG